MENNGINARAFIAPALAWAAGLMLVVMYAPRTEHINGQMLASCSNRRGRRPGGPPDTQSPAPSSSRLPFPIRNGKNSLKQGSFTIFL